SCTLNFKGIPLSQVSPASHDITLRRIDPSSGTLESQPLVQAGEEFGGVFVQHARLVEKNELGENRFTIVYELTLAPRNQPNSPSPWREQAAFSAAVGTDGKIDRCF